MTPSAPRSASTRLEALPGGNEPQRHTVRPARARSRSAAGVSDIDRQVGEIIRLRRISLGLSQHRLAQLIGVTYQQQHEYERGTNRVSAGRLHALARALDVDVAHFFHGLDGPVSDRHDLTLEFSRAFVRIDEKRHQEAICSLARLLADPVDGRTLPVEAGE